MNSEQGSPRSAWNQKQHEIVAIGVNHKKGGETGNLVFNKKAPNADATDQTNPGLMLLDSKETNVFS